MTKVPSIFAGFGSATLALRTCGVLSLVFVGAILANVPAAVAARGNVDESKVPKYTLPDPLVMRDGQPVTSAAMWQQQRRPEILELFRKYVYGRSPGRPEGMRFETQSVATDALGGKAVRKQIRIYVTGREDGPKIDVLAYLPSAVKKPVPVFVGLNFRGNHTIQDDPGIILNRAANNPRGSAQRAGPWRSSCRADTASLPPGMATSSRTAPTDGRPASAPRKPAGEGHGLQGR